MTGYETVARTPELGPGTVREVRLHGRRLALANVGQTYYAVQGDCPADGASLGEGRLNGDLLICPNDHAYDVRDGQAPDSPLFLVRYAIHVTGNEIQVGPPLNGE
jgi:nitrite reductase/ring-hydroxylating ferredoxin subunit